MVILFGMDEFYDLECLSAKCDALYKIFSVTSWWRILLLAGQ
jgi:hypothetical protein